MSTRTHTAYDPPDAERLQDVFVERCEELADRRVVVQSVVDPQHFRVVRPADASRYFETGRKRIMARIRRRLGAWYNVPGIMLTLTYDPGRMEQDEAWYRVGQDRRALINKLNLWRRRHGIQGRPLAYVACLESMPGTGYPHVHVVFPGLRWLAPKEVLSELWSRGWTNIKYHDAMSPVSYACKYIAKLSGWSQLSLAYLSMYHLRIYSVSRRYYLPDLRVRVAEWKFFATTTERGVSVMLGSIASGRSDALIDSG